MMIIRTIYSLAALLVLPKLAFCQTYEESVHARFDELVHEWPAARAEIERLSPAAIVEILMTNRLHLQNRYRLYAKYTTKRKLDWLQEHINAKMEKSKGNLDVITGYLKKELIPDIIEMVRDAKQANSICRDIRDALYGFLEVGNQWARLQKMFEIPGPNGERAVPTAEETRVIQETRAWLAGTWRPYAQKYQSARTTIHACEAIESISAVDPTGENPGLLQKWFPHFEGSRKFTTNFPVQIVKPFLEALARRQYGNKWWKETLGLKLNIMAGNAYFDVWAMMHPSIQTSKDQTGVLNRAGNAFYINFCILSDLQMQVKAAIRRGFGDVDQATLDRASGRTPGRAPLQPNDHAAGKLKMRMKGKEYKHGVGEAFKSGIHRKVGLETNKKARSMMLKANQDLNRLYQGYIQDANQEPATVAAPNMEVEAADTNGPQPEATGQAATAAGGGMEAEADQNGNQDEEAE